MLDWNSDCDELGELFAAWWQHVNFGRIGWNCECKLLLHCFLVFCEGG